MELVPGQAIRQEALAAKLGVSRAPVREALRILQIQGVLHHEPNSGYSVKRLTVAELDQTYMMRRLLETELVRSLPRLSQAQLAYLSQLNRDMKAAVDAEDVATLRRLNYEFHFAILNASSMTLVVDEIDRIWSLTEAYRSFYLYDPAARRRIVREHDKIVAALRSHDLELVVQLLDEHRAGVPSGLGPILAPR